MTDMQAAYVYGLAHLLPLGERSAMKIYRLAPSRDAWNRDRQRLRDQVLTTLGPKSEVLLTANWDALMEQAATEIRRQQEAGVILLGIDDPDYPPLLRQIPDPPLFLFLKGSVSALSEFLAVAIVGTRNSTMGGEQVAFKIAKYFGAHRCLIVSGLAKGIDAAAHKGALDAGAKTVAVFGTSLDKVYPAENKDLAYQILDDGGAWVSELPLHKKGHRHSFVQRDRIQSGLSVAVIPVQTGIEGGTMHTVEFAERQKRLLFCPRPLNVEGSAKQYEGINELIRSGRAKPFQADDYSAVLDKIEERRSSLMSLSFAHSETNASIHPAADQASLAFRDAAVSRGRMDTDLIDVVADKLASAGLTDPSRFEAIVNGVRTRLFSIASHNKKT
jgi:DNA processing protein